MKLEFKSVCVCVGERNINLTINYNAIFIQNESVHRTAGGSSDFGIQYHLKFSVTGSTAQS